MPDFFQSGPISTLHHLGTVDAETLEASLNAAASAYGIGLLLPVTADDMRADPFAHIIHELAPARFLETILVVLNRAPRVEDYLEARRRIAPLGDRGKILWTDGPRGAALQAELTAADFQVDIPGKGRAVWMGFGYLLANSRLNAFVLHDCDIVSYSREMLVRLCLPMAHPSLDFDFCKAYYARCTDRMHGRVARLLVTPLLRALITILGNDPFLVFLDSFRYPLAGEFAVTSMLARSNRMPCDWGLEVGTLAEVFRNTSPKRVCQVDLGSHYEHKHQALSLDDPQRGLMKMTKDILSSILHNLASRGVVLGPGLFVTLRAAYLRMAQDAIRQYHADALMNSLRFDRHSEEQAVEGFAQQITAVGESYHSDPAATSALPTWTRVLTAFPDFPLRLRTATLEDADQYRE